MPAQVTYTRTVLAGQLVRPGLSAINLPIPGGRDSLIPGYYFPTSSNTGLLTDESALTLAGAGNMTYNTPGQIIENKRFEGYVYVQAPGVEFRNCLVVGPTDAVNPIVQCTHANIGTDPQLYPKWVDSEFRPRTNGYFTQTIQGRYHALRCLATGSVDGMGMLGDNGSIRGCILRSLLYFSPFPGGHSDNQTHSDGIQIHGGNGHLIEGNVIEAMSTSYDALRAATYDANNVKNGGNQFWSPGMTEAPTLSGIMINSSTASFASASGNITVRRNWLRGGAVLVNALDTNALVNGGLTFEDNLVGDDMGFGADRVVVTKAGKPITMSGNRRWNRSDPLDRTGATADIRINQ